MAKADENAPYKCSKGNATMKELKVAFVSMKNKQVVDAETADVSSFDEIERRIKKHIKLGYEKTTLIFGDGEVREILLPMTLTEVERRSKSLFDAIFFDAALTKGDV